MCLDTLVFEVYAKKQLTKDNLVGTVELHLASTESAKLDDWLPIKGSHGGTLRVSVAVSNDNVLAKKEYDNLVKLITEPNLELVTAFGRETNCKEAYAKILVDIMVSERKDFEFLKTLIKNEIEATENSSIIFRGNSLASKAIDYYMKLVGSEFLISTLQGPILTILRSKDHCEIDETKLEKNEDVNKNLKRLKAATDLVWESIVSSITTCPNEMKVLFGFLWKFSEEKFGGTAKYASVSGFLFLRFFVPAILNPKLFGIMNENPESSAARTLTLVAKSIQNLGNLIDHDTVKESHMTKMRPFLKKNEKVVKNIIQKVSQSHETKSRAYARLSGSSNRQLAKLVSFFMERIQSVPTQLRIVLFEIEATIEQKENDWKSFFVSKFADYKQKGALSIQELNSIKNLMRNTKHETHLTPKLLSASDRTLIPITNPQTGNLYDPVQRHSRIASLLESELDKKSSSLNFLRDRSSTLCSFKSMSGGESGSTSDLELDLEFSNDALHNDDSVQTLVKSEAELLPTLNNMSISPINFDVFLK